MLLENRFQPPLRLPFSEDVSKCFEAVETQIPGVGHGLSDVIGPGNPGMANLDIPFLFSEPGQSCGSRAQGR
jgi:hypothetical protein